MLATSATSPDAARKRAFDRLTTEVRRCDACSRMDYAHVLSAANGPLDGPIMFVAEAPGRRGAAITGVPLSRDESGRRFEAFLRIAGLTRDDVFITNALLCNPLAGLHRNRTPTTTELARCRPFLAATIDIIDPPIVVALGRVALDTLRVISPHDGALSAGAASPIPWRDRTLIPMYHPSRQSTLHRSHEQQERDWSKLGAIVKTATRLQTA